MLEIRASFFVECEELLEALQDGLAGLDDGMADGETVNVLFRAVHSIKGGAGAFGLEDLVCFAHSFESILDAVRSNRLAPEAEHIRLFFRCADVLSDLIRAAREDTGADGAAVAAVLSEIETLAGGALHDDEPVIDFQPAPLSLDLDFPVLPGSDDGTLRRIAISFRPEPELYTSGNEPLFLLRALAELGETEVDCAFATGDLGEDFGIGQGLLSWRIVLWTVHEERDIRDVFEFVEGLCSLSIAVEYAVPSAPFSAPATQIPGAPPPEQTFRGAPPPLPWTAAPTPAAPSSSTRTAAAAPATVRVDLDRIERLVNLVGELVINQAMLSQSFTVAGLAGHGQISSGLDEFLRLTRDIQDSVMMIRAQPVKSLFQRMGRIVRESSHAVGKSVRLVTAGETTEIDKTMIERLSDPLTHMIRNAVDHGLELPEIRRAAGKPAQGTVTLTAGHRSGRVVIEVSDDGGGINRAKVQAIAEQRGLIAAGQSLSETEIDNLLFLAGFSTTDQVSNLSGRGVGMDVVKNAISGLGGRISILSAPGRGTTFSISLPLTLAILDEMVVKVSGETLVVPLGAIVETLTLKRSNLTTLGPAMIAVRVRDIFVPLIDLAARFGYAAPRSDYDQAIALLIAHDDGSRAAVVVDTIVDQRQVVIKGLEDSYGRVPGIAAATILGDGRIALILDPSDLGAPAPSRPHDAPLLAHAG